MFIRIFLQGRLAGVRSGARGWADSTRYFMATFSIAVAIRNIILNGRGTEYEDAPKNVSLILFG